MTTHSEPIPADLCRKTIHHQAGEFTAAVNRLGDAILATLPRRLRWRQPVQNRVSRCSTCGQAWS
jgi:hypothetical protein